MSKWIIETDNFIKNSEKNTGIDKNLSILPSNKNTTVNENINYYNQKPKRLSDSDRDLKQKYLSNNVIRGKKFCIFNDIYRIRIETIT